MIEAFERRTTTMSYNKPELLTLASSIKAIQGTMKSLPHITETINGVNKPESTPLAYEADE